MSTLLQLLMRMKPGLTLKISGIALVLALCGGTIGARKGAVKATRDWTKYPAVVEVDTNEDVFAISDAHADYTRVAGVLAAAKIIKGLPVKPSQVSWTAGKSVLVVVGDMVDKWKHSVKVIEFIQELQKSAAAQGGQVIVTMGNHEAEFLANPTGKKTREFSDDLTKNGYKPKSVANCEGELGQFLCQLPMAVRVNDWFFCHAGNTSGQGITGLSAAIEAGFATDGFATEELVGDNSILEARLNSKGPGGLPWFDNGSLKTDPQNLLTQYAAALGVHRAISQAL